MQSSSIKHPQAYRSMTVHSYNPNAWEPRQKGFLECKASWSGLHSVSLSQNKDTYICTLQINPRTSNRILCLIRLDLLHEGNVGVIFESQLM